MRYVSAHELTAASLCSYLYFCRHGKETRPFRSNLAEVARKQQYYKPLRPLPSPLPTSQQELDLLLATASSTGDLYNVIRVSHLLYESGVGALCFGPDLFIFLLVIQLCKEGANVAINYTSDELNGPLADSLWDAGVDTPLNRACAKGSLRVVELMVDELDAKVNSTGMRSGFSPLHAAAKGGNCNVVRCLIKRGAKVNAAVVSGTDKTSSAPDLPELYVGYTALMLAVTAKDPWSVNELLLAGAQNNVRAMDGKTPQMLLQEMTAIHAWDPAMAMLSSLLENGVQGIPRPDPK